MKTLAFSLLLLLSTSGFAQYLNRTISNQVDYVNHGHFSITTIGQNEYFAAGTRYQAPISSNQSAISIKTFNSSLQPQLSELITSGYDNAKCYRMKKTSSGNFLLMGSTGIYGIHPQGGIVNQGLIIELDQNLNIIKHKIIYPTNDPSDLRSLIILDAEPVGEDYFIAGIRFDGPIEDLDNKTFKEGFYGLLSSDFNTIHYMRLYGMPSTPPSPPLPNDFDQINRVKYIPGVGMLIMGAKNEGSPMLALVEPPSGNVLWEFNEKISKSSLYEFIADVHYLPAYDELIVAMNAHDPYHSFELFSISNFSTTKTVNTIHECYFGFYGDNVWANQILPVNGSPEKFIINVVLSNISESCSTPTGAYSQNVKSGYIEYDRTLTATSDFIYKESPVYAWNTSYHYFNSMTQDKPPIAYTNAMTYNISNPNNDYTLVHYRTDSTTIDLELTEIGPSYQLSPCMSNVTEVHTTSQTITDSLISSVPFHPFIDNTILRKETDNTSINQILCSVERISIGCTDATFRKKSNSAEDLQELSSEITIYPNPVMDKFTVKTAGFAEEISVFDASGKEVSINLINPTSADIAHLESGLYFIKIQLNHKSVVKKIVKY